MASVPFSLACRGRKVCSKCHVEKSVDEFYRDPRKQDGLVPRCKPCFKLSLKRHPFGTFPSQSPKAKAERTRRNGEVDCEYIPRDKRLTAAAEKRKVREVERTLRAAARIAARRPPKPTPGSKAWYTVATADEIDTYRAAARKYFAKRYHLNPASERSRVQLYKAARPHKREQWNGVRARRIDAQADGTLTRKVVGRLFADARQCPYCDVALTVSNKALDHVHPLALGGVHGIGNVVIACRDCNHRKHAKHPDVWLAEIGRGEMLALLPRALA